MPAKAGADLRDLTYIRHGDPIHPPRRKVLPAEKKGRRFASAPRPCSGTNAAGSAVRIRTVHEAGSKPRGAPQTRWRAGMSLGQDARIGSPKLQRRKGLAQSGRWRG
jgi:hypothetical protein